MRASGGVPSYVRVIRDNPAVMQSHNILSSFVINAITEANGVAGNEIVVVAMGNIRMVYDHPSFFAKSSARKCVYRRSIRRSLCPVMLATSMMFSPFSNNLVVASCRRS